MSLDFIYTKDISNIDTHKPYHIINSNQSCYTLHPTCYIKTLETKILKKQNNIIKTLATALAWDRLNPELLTVIMSFIKDKYIYKLRRVSKLWNSVALRAIKTLIIGCVDINHSWYYAPILSEHNQVVNVEKIRIATMDYSKTIKSLRTKNLSQALNNINSNNIKSFKFTSPDSQVEHIVQYVSGCKSLECLKFQIRHTTPNFDNVLSSLQKLIRVEIDCISNSIHYFPQFIDKTSIRSIRIRGYDDKHFYFTNSSTNITRLSIHNTNINFIKNLDLLKNVKLLQLISNRIFKIDFKLPPNLMRLDLRSNHIKNITEVVKSYSTLTSLNLSNNPIKKIPIEVITATNLTSLKLKKTYAVFVGVRVHVENMGSTHFNHKKIFINDGDFDCFDTIICSQTLTELSLKGVKNSNQLIKEIKKVIGTVKTPMSSLIKLDISNNTNSFIATFLNFINGNNNLQKLWMDGSYSNMLPVRPVTIDSCLAYLTKVLYFPSLKYIDISYHIRHTFPLFVFNMKKVEIIIYKPEIETISMENMLNIKKHLKYIGYIGGGGRTKCLYKTGI